MPDVSLLQREYYGGGEEESRIPGIAALVAFILFFIAAVAYGGLYFYNRSLISHAQGISENIKGLHVGDVAQTIDELKTLGNKAKGLQELRESHTDFTGILGIFERTTHPTAVFSDADFDVKSRTAKLKGQIETTRAMARQVEIYQREGSLSEFSFENIAYKDEDKAVGFQASVTFIRK